MNHGLNEEPYGPLHVVAMRLPSEVQSFADFMLRGNLAAMVPSALIPMVQIPQVVHRAARRSGAGRRCASEELNGPLKQWLTKRGNW